MSLGRPSIHSAVPSVATAGVVMPAVVVEPVVPVRSAVALRSAVAVASRPVSSFVAATPRRGGSRYAAGVMLAGLLLAMTVPTCVEAQQGERFMLGPPSASGPTVVEVGFFLADVNQIDLENQRFEFEAILTARWQDDRQRFDTLAAGVSEKIFQGRYQFSEIATGWWPQLVIANESGPYVRQGQLLRQRWDGAMTYVEELNATVEIPVNLRRFPFERESFEVVFEVLGFDESEVTLVPDASSTGVAEGGIRIVGWDLHDLRAGTRTYDPVYADDHVSSISALVVFLDLARQPGFMLRVVVFPMILLVALSWSVFWMDRESLGERMSISFLAILSVVAYQLTVSGMLPKIPYFTLLSAFIYISFVTICACVLINLRVGHLDRAGRVLEGNRIDRICRWAFPSCYVASLVLATTYFFIRY